MSSIKRQKIRHTSLNHSFSIDFGDNMHREDMTTFADYVRDTMNAERLSGYEIERRTKGKITQSYVNRIRNGEATNLSLEKLRILAVGLGRSESEVLAAASGTPIQKLTHSRLASLEFAYEGMSEQQKERADYIIELLEREIHRIENESD